MVGEGRWLGFLNNLKLEGFSAKLLDGNLQIFLVLDDDVLVFRVNIEEIEIFGQLVLVY